MKAPAWVRRITNFVTGKRGLTVFNGATGGRLTMDWIAGILSADQEIKGNMRLLRARARELSRNNPVAKAYLKLLTANVLLGGLFFKHETVNHSSGEYKRGDVSTNSIESVWAVMKRGMHGVYHKASKKHLRRYVDEFTFRLNAGKVQRHTLDRLASLVIACAGRRLTYRELTA